MENILLIIGELNERYNGTLSFEITIRKNEPEFEIKATTSLKLTVTYYLSEEKANSITNEEVRENIDFLIQQEEYRRKVITDKCILS